MNAQDLADLRDLVERMTPSESRLALAMLQEPGPSEDKDTPPKGGYVEPRASPRLRTPRTAAMLEQIKAGEKYTVIAARFGVSRKTVNGLAIRHGIYRKGDWTKQL